MTRLKSARSGKGIDVDAQSRAFRIIEFLLGRVCGLCFAAGDVSSPAFRADPIGNRDGGMGRHAFPPGFLTVVGYMLVLMRHDSRCRLSRGKVCRRLKRNGWIIRPIHILPALSGLAFSGGQIYFAGLLSAPDPLRIA